MRQDWLHYVFDSLKRTWVSCSWIGLFWSLLFVIVCNSRGQLKTLRQKFLHSITPSRHITWHSWICEQEVCLYRNLVSWIGICLYRVIGRSWVSLYAIIKLWTPTSLPVKTHGHVNICLKRTSKNIGSLRVWCDWNSIKNNRHRCMKVLHFLLLHFFLILLSPPQILL